MHRRKPRLYQPVSAGEKLWRHGEAAHRCGLGGDDQLEPGGLQDRQVGRFVALENPPAYAPA